MLMVVERSGGCWRQAALGCDDMVCRRRIEWGPTGLAHLLMWHGQVVLVVWHDVVVVGQSSTMMVGGGGD